MQSDGRKVRERAVIKHVCQTLASLSGLWNIIGEASSKRQPCREKIPYVLTKRSPKNSAHTAAPELFITLCSLGTAGRTFTERSYSPLSCSDNTMADNEIGNRTQGSHWFDANRRRGVHPLEDFAL